MEGKTLIEREYIWMKIEIPPAYRKNLTDCIWNASLS